MRRTLNPNETKQRKQAAIATDQTTERPEIFLELRKATTTPTATSTSTSHAYIVEPPSPSPHSLPPYTSSPVPVEAAFLVSGRRSPQVPLGLRLGPGRHLPGRCHKDRERTNERERDREGESDIETEVRRSVIFSPNCTRTKRNKHAN